MAKNPETIVTNRLRAALDTRGCHTIKLSDQFTRGVPDLMVAGVRLVVVEIKVDRRKGDPEERTYKSLGLSGAQDHHIRQIFRRTFGSACVITDSEKGGKLRLWIPVQSSMEGPGHDVYICIAKGDEVVHWLM